MNAGIVAFSAAGVALGRRIAGLFESWGWSVSLSAPARLAGEGVTAVESSSGWAKEHFNSCRCLVVVGSCGLAVRLVAPHLRSKTTDPAVLVADDGGRFVVSLLSGHLGGANRLAARVADALGGAAVVTTATDGRGLTAIDTWAADRGLRIENPPLIAPVSALLLDGGAPGWWSDEDIEVPDGFEARAEGPVGAACSARILSDPFERTLWLRPPVLSLGVGCRRGVSFQALKAELERFASAVRWSVRSIVRVASVDLKKNEPGLLALAESLSAAPQFFSADGLMALLGNFSRSEWVISNVGVDCVCERAAMAVSGGGRLVEGKWKGSGVTFALARLGGEDSR
ncbi:MULTISPECIES: cobalt-precorrin 5A hydrolase [Jonquetella]|uniref:Cobalamin biosynthesis protein CbiG n=1 Tax=Jonquetella anthropi DSM 22815 TaxID=885272 RepID=H0ULN0_9BACT|nr:MULTISPECIES: cobalamin biosynthesis protein [Jonquetella]EHM12495.1 cobalamin biosynthesis protein CbiG [Jonquetella anthropi DSM 22815]ERL24796.1 cobalamin biosynthesis protein [Jonquetella sp. BV3C21]